jgi:transcriptional regulator with XRE-family HTH domain
VTAGELIKAVRVRQGLTQADLARRAGTSQPVISAYERGLRDPTTDTLRRLISAAGERLTIEAAPWGNDLRPAATAEERARRLIAVLELADAIPKRKQAARLSAPRLVSS